MVGAPGGVGGAKKGGDSGGKRGGGAGADGLDVGCVAKVETTVAVRRVRWWAIGGGRFAGAAGAANPSADSEVAA